MFDQSLTLMTLSKESSHSLNEETNTEKFSDINATVTATTVENATLDPYQEKMVEVNNPPKDKRNMDEI